VDIENQLGYTYILSEALVTGPATHPPLLRVQGANRAAISGSFMISTWVSDPSANTPKTLVGLEAVLSRWHVSGCANCQNHLGVKAFVPLHGLTPEQAQKAAFEVKVHTREDPQGSKIKLPKPDLQVQGV
jgi:tyrosinase